MRGIFDDEEPEPARPRRDTELTLGAGMLFGIFAGLVLLCALCFGLGYVVGGRHHSLTLPAATAQQPAASAPAEAAQEKSAPKPSATGENGAARQSATDVQGRDGAGAAQPGTDAGANAQSSAPAAGNGAAPPPPFTVSPVQARSDEDSPSQAGSGQVRPALPPTAKPTQPAQPVTGTGGGAKIGSGAQVETASAGATTLMVQIAAVSHVEDATVLVNALRKRGYEVTTRREPSDELIHVRIGPFSSRDEAEKWRLKLLNDGYNALVQP